MEIIFEGKNMEAADLRKELFEIKEHFKLCCNVIIGEMHNDDFEDLNRSMYLELDKHFSFWADKFKDIHEQAVSALKKLEEQQSKDRNTFNDLQQNIHSLMPKSMKPVKENKEIELQLVNMNE